MAINPTVRTIVYDDDGVLLKEKEMRQINFNDVLGYKLLYNNRRVKHFSNIPLPEKITMIERGMLLTLSRCMFNPANLLAKKTRAGVIPMTEDDIFEAIEANERKGKVILRKFVDLGILAKVKITTEGITSVQYYMNPLYFFNSTWLSPNLYLLFKAQLDQYIPLDVQERMLECVKANPQGVVKKDIKIAKLKIV